MNVLFIHTAKDSGADTLYCNEEIQLGISYISAQLKAHGHATRLLFLGRHYTTAAIDDAIAAFAPKLVCFSAVFSEYPFVAEIAGQIKARYPQLFLLAGGAHVTLDPEACLADPFDALCLGEGEQPTRELVEQLGAGRTPSGIANLWIKTEAGVERNAPRPFIADLDALPVPDRALWTEWIAEPGSRHVVLLGRGCPFPCTYCSNHRLRRVAEGRYVRQRRPERIVAEIRQLLAEAPATREIYLEVESFSVDIDWALAVCASLAELNTCLAAPISFGVNLRLTRNNDFARLFPALAKANFRFVNIGLESGSERVRSEILRRDYSNAAVVEAVRLAREHGLQVSMYVLIGVPGESRADFRQTVDLLREAAPDYCADSIFFPYPKTVLYERALADGLISPAMDLACERHRAVLDLPDFPRRAIERCHILFDYYVYRGRRPWYQLLPSIVNKFIYASPLLQPLSNSRLLTGARNRLRRWLYPSNL